MEKLTREEVQKMLHTKQDTYQGTYKLRLSDPAFGDDKKHTVTFDVYDGFAVGYFGGKEYYLEYPTLDFINKAETMKKNVLEGCGHADDADYHVLPLDVLISYNTVYCNSN